MCGAGCWAVSAAVAIRIRAERFGKLTICLSTMIFSTYLSRS